LEILSSDQLEEICALAAKSGFNHVQLIYTSEIVTARWVSLKCRYGCSQYDRSWCCPPAAPNLEATRELLSEYEVALLLAGEKTNEHFHRNSNQKRRVQVKQWKGTIAIERRLFLMGYYKAFGLPGESCALCKECSYPEPCKFPNEKRPSVEACSIDILETAKRLGRPVKVAENIKETYNSYALVLVV